jgi:hypothetical protein
MSSEPTISVVFGRIRQGWKGSPRTKRASLFVKTEEKFFLNIVAWFSISNEEAAAFVSTSILQRLVTIHAE